MPEIKFTSLLCLIPIKVKVYWEAQRLKEAVFERSVGLDRKGFEGKTIISYKPVYKNGERIRYIPGTTTDFTIKLYKEDLLTAYSSIIVYLL